MDWTTLAVGVVTALAAMYGTYKANQKQTALMDYRLKKLEEKVGQHNNLEGRVIKLETQMTDLHAG